MKVVKTLGIWSWWIDNESYWDFGERPYFYPEERIRFTLPELKAIVQEMEKMEKANAIRPE